MKGRAEPQDGAGSLRGAQGRTEVWRGQKGSDILEISSKYSLPGGEEPARITELGQRLNTKK